jgi:hypothetical protein
MLSQPYAFKAIFSDSQNIARWYQKLLVTGAYWKEKKKKNEHVTIFHCQVLFIRWENDIRMDLREIR